jgi:hypothetical protein
LGAAPPPNTEYWWRYSLGASLGISKNPTNAKTIADVFQKLDKTTVGVHQQYYYMLYGNGGDKLTDGKNKGKDVTGWHWRNPIDTEDNQ